MKTKNIYLFIFPMAISFYGCVNQEKIDKDINDTQNQIDDVIEQLQKNEYHGDSIEMESIKYQSNEDINRLIELEK